MTRCVDELTVK